MFDAIENELNLRLLLGSLLAFASFDLLAPALPGFGHGAQLAYSAFVTIPLLTLPVHAAGPAHRLGTRLLVVAVPAVIIAVLSSWFGIEGTTPTLAKLVAATCVGFVLAGMVRSRAAMMAIAILISAVDIYSVAGGPTRAMVLAHGGEVHGLALALHKMASHVFDQIGSSDLFFVALFTTAAMRFGLRRWTTWIAMTASLALSILLSDRWHGPVPALPLLSAGFLIANLDIFLTREPVPVPATPPRPSLRTIRTRGESDVLRRYP